MHRSPLRRHLAVSAACLSFALLAGCGGPTEISDDSLTESVSERLRAERDLAPFDLDVEADEGVVTLEGTVESDSQRMAAERIARSTAGVRGVSNEIELGGAPPAVGAPPPPAPPIETE
jgi:hypothetical protein